MTRCVAAKNARCHTRPCRSRNPSDGPDELDVEQTAGISARLSGPSLVVTVIQAETAIECPGALDVQYDSRSDPATPLRRWGQVGMLLYIGPATLPPWQTTLSARLPV